MSQKIVAFQGVLGAYSHMAAQATLPDYEVMPCGSFSEMMAQVRDGKAQMAAGASAGILGGLTSLWAMPIVMYLAARHTKKEEFIRARGFLITAGSLPLLFGYAQLGYLNVQNATLSLLLVIPTFAGFMIGERIRGYLSERVFFNALMVLFFLMGLNLLRRGLIG